MAKRLTELQKKKIIQSFKDGKTIEALYKDFNCTKLTIIRNLKIHLGDEIYKKLLKRNKESSARDISDENTMDINHEESNRDFDVTKKTNELINKDDFYPDSSFLEISPVNFEIDNEHRKELSSVAISEIDFPQIVYMIVNKKIELEIKLLKDFPEWRFLPIDDLNRKTIEIYFDLKVAKRFCNKEQKVIKVPNTNVFKIAAPFLISKGISRIVSDDILIAL